MFFSRRERLDVDEARRRERAVQRVEEVTDELRQNANELKSLVAKIREQPYEGVDPR